MSRKKIPREIRFCGCDCGGSKEVPVNSTWKYFSGHNVRVNNPMERPEVVAKMADTKRGRTKENHPGTAAQAEKMRGRTKENHPGVAEQSRKMAGRKQSKVTIVKRVETRRNNGEPWHSEETKEKMGSSKLGSNNPMYEKCGELHPNWVPIETRICGCGCEGTFECKVSSKQKYIYGHGRRLPKEIRTCLYNVCDNTLEVIINSKRKYCSIGCARRNLWQDRKYRERVLKAIFKGLAVKPNKPEKLLNGFLQKLLPREYILNVNGGIIVAGKCPDFISINGRKKIIEMNGAWWHGEKRTGRTKEEEEKQRIDLFAKEGYQTLVIWDYELENLRELAEKIIAFHKQS